jgi:uncharacterized membrane protein YhhN
MYIWLLPALLFASLEAIAVARNLHSWEYIAKPAVMVFLFLWLYSSTGLQGNPFWFGLGILFSLAGDILLMFPSERFFLPGLVAFLFAHIVYITGLREALANTNMWSLLLLILLAISVSRLLRRIVGAMHARGEDKLILPVVIYGIVIACMLYAAMSTIYDPTWTTSATFLVSTGAFLFTASDAFLAWMKFVSPVRNGRVWSIVMYHLGQIGIIAGAISQFG